MLSTPIRRRHQFHDVARSQLGSLAATREHVVSAAHDPSLPIRESTATYPSPQIWR